VDLEEMYNPDFSKPKEIPAGSPGYAHKSAPRGIWSDEADRFAGGVLLAEMLCWGDPTVREISWGESYFSPRDMQNENKRLDVLRESLVTHYGKRILELFDQAWGSDSLRDCPTFAEWSVALPATLRTKEEVVIIESEVSEEKEVPAHPKLEKYQERSCLVCGKTIPAGQEICPYCEGMAKGETEVENEVARFPTEWIISGVVFLVLGAVLIRLGMGGRGPLSTLASATSLPSVTRTSVPTATQTPAPTVTQTPAPTATVTPFFTPNPASKVGSKIISPLDDMTMMYIPAGTFWMGSGNGENDEVPVHEVYLDSFWMDQHEVTLGQYQVFMEDSGYSANPCGSGENYPVACVSWYDAEAYCEWAGKRLPSEAEWEKAASGPDDRTFSWGFNFDGNMLNYCDINCDESWSSNSFNDGYKGAAPVGSYSPDDYGLVDISGNVWEWVADWYSEEYYKNSSYENPKGPTEGETRVDRGGSFNVTAGFCRSENRHWGYPDERSYSDVGFRCVISNKLSDSTVPAITTAPDINELVVAWEFDRTGDTQGWGVEVWDKGDLESITVNNGVLSADSTGPDPMIYLRNLSINSDLIAKIEIRLRVSAGTTGQLHFSTEDIDMNDYHHPFLFFVQPGDEFYSYDFNTQIQSGWNGVITELRLDPTDDIAHIEIDYIRLYRTQNSHQ
jgi:formylglycine-generating enzyme required for sulfatase activity